MKIGKLEINENLLKSKKFILVATCVAALCIIVPTTIKSQGKDSQTSTSRVETVNVEYLVKEGDTLTDIALYFNVNVYDIILENQGKINDADIIEVGDKLIIPNVRKEIADHYNEKVAKRIDIKYEVVLGDKLELIAKKFDVTVESIVEANNIQNKDVINVGDKLIIPNALEIIVDNVNNSSEQKPQINNSENLHQGNLPTGLVRGIDVSSWNGSLDWDIIEQYYKDGKIQYVILRMAENWDTNTQSYKFTLDDTFEKNLSECNKRGIPYGVYVFSRCYDQETADRETSSIIEYIDNNLNQTKYVDGETLDLTFNLSLPFYMDCFEPDAKTQLSIFKNGHYDDCESLIRTWCDAIEEAGYFTGVYCNGDFYNTMGINRLSDYSLWIAHYGAAAVIDEVEDIVSNGLVGFNSIVKSQQVTENGIMDGMNCHFDVNITDEDLLQIVKAFYSNKQVYHR